MDSQGDNQLSPADNAGIDHSGAHAVVVPAKHYAVQSVAFCAATASITMLIYFTMLFPALVSGRSNDGFLVVVLVIFLQGLIDKLIGGKFRQIAIYDRDSDTVITDCRTVQRWNAISILNGVVYLWSIAAVIGVMVWMSAFKVEGFEWGPLLFVVPVAVYIYRLKSVAKTFQASIESGERVAGGTQFTIDFSGGPDPKKFGRFLIKSNKS